MSGEFDLIEAIVEVLGDSARADGVIVGPGDDAAVMRPPPGRDLVVSVDTLVAGRHFPADAPPDLIGYRALGVSVSDLAAMGAAPAWCVVSLTAEELDDRGARAYAAGFARAARAFAIAIVGGNLARGPANLCVTVHGTAAPGACLRRDGAAAGEDVYVSGSVGAAVLALGDPDLARRSFDAIEPGSACERYWLPRPRTELGAGLAGLATAAIDVSDGLTADLEHLCSASGVGLDLDVDAVPVFGDVDPLAALAAGDDYELAFTAPPEAARAVIDAGRNASTPVSRIGRTTAEPGVRCRRGADRVYPPRGYRHF